MRNYDWVKFTTSERINARYREAEVYRLAKVVSTGTPLFYRLLDGPRNVLAAAMSVLPALHDLSKRPLRAILVR